MRDLTLIKQEMFGEIECDFYKNGKSEVWMSREQIGKALGYADGSKSIDKIHSRHKERLDKYSDTVKLTATDGKNYDITVYNSIGVYEICRWSKTEKANQFYDWVYSVLEKIRTKDNRFKEIAQTLISNKLDLLDIIGLDKTAKKIKSLTALLNALNRSKAFTPEQIREEKERFEKILNL